MSSAMYSDTEINSSPIGIHEYEGNISISSKPSNRRQKRPKVVDDENDDISLWSEAKRQSWAAIDTNPNAFYYRHCAPGEQKRNGAWDAYEKKLFLETMKVHPPSQGRWGLFAQHIPGRVGYQCRNFYHRLLESGEIKALPEEIEKMQRPRKRKTSTIKHSSPKQKIEINEDPENEEEEMNLLIDDKESSSTSESEEITLNHVKKLTFSNKNYNEFKEKEENLNQTEFAPNSHDFDSYQYEVITHLDNDLVQPQNIEAVPQILPTEIITESIPSIPYEESTITEETENVPPTVEESNANCIKWTPRMKEPWKTLNPEQIERLKSKKDEPFQFEASRILNSNYNNPLNVILFSLNVNNNKSTQYINAVRDHLSNDNQNTIDGLLRRYFKVQSNPAQTDEFADYVIATAKSY